MDSFRHPVDLEFHVQKLSDHFDVGRRMGRERPRIRARVSQGGHDVPEPVVRRRFERGLRNFEQVYRRLVDSWALYDSSGQAPILIDAGDNA